MTTTTTAILKRIRADGTMSLHLGHKLRLQADEAIRDAEAGVEAEPQDDVLDGLLATRSRLADELATAELKALKALAGYKLIMFGYHGAQWVLLNRVAGGRRPNPFRFLVQEARRALQARGQAILADFTNEHGDAVALEEVPR